MPKTKWPNDDEARARIGKGWHRVWGDRRQELVFIGTLEMDKDAIIAELDGCLLDVPDRGALDAKSWTSLEDPFPAWARA